MRRRRGERGATTVEYGLIVAGIALVVMVPLHGIEVGVKQIFERQCHAPGVTCTRG